jgi:outer membrane receptor for ferrienterochelin and colicins
MTHRRHERAVRAAVCALLAVLAVPAPCSAGQEPAAESGAEAIVFQEIPSVYGVSRFEQKITEAPSFVTLISSAEITRFGYRTLAEALRGVTGFFVSYDRNYNYLGVRGFNRPGDFNTRVLLLVDGHRLNDNLYDQAGLGTESVVDVDMIDRIEVIRGPSSSLYGTNAFFGVINVITKRGRDVGGLELSSEAASFRSFRGRATYGERFGSGTELLLSGSYYDAQGQRKLHYPEFDDASSGHGDTRNADDDRFPSLFGKLTVRDLTLQGGFVSREKGIPTGSYGTVFPSDRTRSTDEHGYLFLDYQHHFGSQLQLSSRLYYDRFYYRADYLFDDPQLVLNQDRSIGEWWGSELKLNRRFLDSHNVTAGVEYRNNFRQDLFNGDRNPPSVTLDDERDSWNSAVFLQDEITLHPDWILSAGLRHDYYNSFGDSTNPRVALIHTRGASTFKLLYGTAFRGANIYERFYVGTGFKANPGLNPERVRTAELVFEQRLTHQLRFTAAHYRYTIDDLVSQESDPGDGVLVFRNQDEIDAHGYEAQLELDEHGRFGVSGRLGYAWQRAAERRPAAGLAERLSNSPTHLVNLNLVLPLVRERVSAGLETLYVSRRRTLAGHRASDYAVVNFTLLFKNLRPGVDVSLGAHNLLDKKYFDPGSGEQVQDQLEQDGRSFRLRLGYRF